MHGLALLGNLLRNLLRTDWSFWGTYYARIGAFGELTTHGLELLGNLLRTDWSFWGTYYARIGAFGELTTHGLALSGNNYAVHEMVLLENIRNTGCLYKGIMQ